MIKETTNTIRRNKPIALLLATIIISAISPFADAENWPAWRGPRADGTSMEKNIPVEWSNTKNILWKTPLPGKGHASPIVWGDRIFLVTAILKEKSERVLLALDLLAIAGHLAVAITRLQDTR